MWTYVDPRGKLYMKSKSYYSFGLSLHAALQRFHDSNDVGVTTTAEAVAALEESWIDAGYTSAEEMADALGEGREIIERHVQEAIARPSQAKSIFVEKQFRADLGEFALIGRVDRVDEHPDGSLEIVDYKSGRPDITTEEVESDLAMGIYQLLLHRQFPLVPLKATIIALRTGRFASASLSPEQLQELEFDVIELGRRMLNTNWDEHTPVHKALCEKCDFIKLCSKSPEFGA